MLGRVVKVVDRATVVLVLTFDSQSFSSGQIGERSEARTIGLNRESVEVGHQSPLSRQSFDRHVDSFPAGVGFSTVREIRTRRQLRRVLRRVLHGVSPLFVFTNAVQMVGDASLRYGTEWRIDTRVKSILIDD